MDMNHIYPFVGACIGFIVGLTGIGGGALMTPILLLIFGVAPTTAVATDLWFAAITKFAAVLIHHREQQVEWSVVRKLWLGSLPAALITVIALGSGALVSFNSKSLTSLIGAVILITAISLPGVSLIKTKNSRFLSGNMQKINRLLKPLTIFAGVMIGILVSLTSVGAGALGSVVLLYLYPGRLNPNKLVGTDIAHAIPLALVAGLGYLIVGKVDGHLLFLLLLGSTPGAMIGSFAATRFSHRKLRFFLMAILGISGLRLIF